MRNLLFALLSFAAIGLLAWFGMSNSGGADQAPAIATWNESDVETVLAPEVEVVDGPELAPTQRTDVAVDEIAAEFATGSELQLSISGRVVDADGQPIAGANVRLQVAQRRFGRSGRGTRDRRVRKSVTTGGDGTFDFAGPGTTQSRIQLVVQHAAFAPLLVDRRVENDNGRCAVGDLTVIRGAILTGRVTNRDGQGVAGAKVDIQPRDGNRLAWSSARRDVLEPLETDQLGGYRFEQVMPGSYRVQATARGLQRGLLRAPIRLDDGEEQEVSPIVLQPGAILSGTVFTPAGQPLAQAEVRIRAARDRGHSQETGEDGKFEFENLPQRELELVVKADGFLSWTQSEIDPLNPPGGGAGIIVKLERGLTLDGRVIDAASGAAVDRFAAKLERVRGLNRGGELGEMEAMIADMRRRVGNTDPARAKVIEGRMTERMRSMDRNAIRTHGRAMSRRWGRGNRPPLDLGPITTRDNGQFRFEGLAEGVYLVYIDSPDHQMTKTEEVELRREAVAPPAIVSVERGVSLRGIVLAANTGKPVSDARVELMAVRDETPESSATDIERRARGRRSDNRLRALFGTSGPRGDRILRVTTDAEGRYGFLHAKPGAYFVRIEIDGFSDLSTTPFTLDQDRDGFEIEILPTARISGRVTGLPSDGEPIRVLAFAGFGRGRMQDVPVAEDGSYVIQDAQPGNYVMRAFRGDLRSYISSSMQRLRGEEIQPDVVVEAGGDYTFDMLVDIIPVGQIEGIIHHNDRPGGNLRVRLREISDQAAGEGRSGPGFGRRGRSATSDSEGTFELDGVTVGTYTLSVTRSGRGRNELWSREITVLEGTTNQVDIRIVTGSLRGTVTAPDGTPAEQLSGTLILLPGAVEVPENLRAYERQNPSQRIRVRNGSFAEESVPTGPALAVLRIRGRDSASLPVHMVAGDNDLTVTAGVLSQDATPPAGSDPANRGGADRSGSGGNRGGGGRQNGR